MEYIVQIRGDHRIYPIPEGLYELMADITREVLRSQPQNLYKFIYNYLDAQIKTRVLTIEAMKILNEIIIDGQPMTSYLAERGLTLDEANEAAKKIQQFWRRVSSMRKLRKVTIEDEKKKRKSFIQEIETRLKTEQILQKYKLTLQQAENFATKIQAVFRGFITRKTLKSEIPREESFASWDHDWLWEHFEDEESISLIPPGKLAEVTKKLLKYLPRRHIAVDKIKLKNLLHGTEEDYERESTPSLEFEGMRVQDRSKAIRRPTSEEWEEESIKDHDSIFLTIDEAASEEEEKEEEEEEVSTALTEIEVVEGKEDLELPGEEEPREYVYEEEVAAEEAKEGEIPEEGEVVEGVAIDEEQEVVEEPAVEEEKKEEAEIPTEPVEAEGPPEFMDDFVLYGEGIPDEIQQYTEYSEDEDERVDAGEDIAAEKDSEAEDEGGAN